MRKASVCCWVVELMVRSTQLVITLRSALLSKKCQRRMPSMYTAHCFWLIVRMSLLHDVLSVVLVLSVCLTDCNAMLSM